MMLFEKIVKTLLKENCTNFGMQMEFVDNDPKKGFYIYHTTRRNDDGHGVKIHLNLAKVGLRRQHSGLGQGEMYGKGCYTTYNFLSSKINVTGNGWYGDVIVKGICRANLKKFLIFDPPVARQVYGRDVNIDEQLKMIFKGNEDILQKMYDTYGYHPGYGHNGNLSSCNASYRDSKAVSDGIFTSVGAQVAWAVIYSTEQKYHMRIRNRFIDGVLYSGGNDGNCVIPFDFASVEPIAYTLNLGQTWEHVDRNNWQHYNLTHNVDLKYELDFTYDYFRTEGFKDGFAVVGKQINGMKFRVLNQKKYYDERKKGDYDGDGRISDIYFDEVYGSSFDMHNNLRVKYKNMDFILHKDTPYNYSVYDTYEHYLCNLKNLDAMLNQTYQPSTKPKIQNQMVQPTADELDDI